MQLAFPVVMADEHGEGSTPNPLIPAIYDIVWSAVVFAIVLAFFLWLVPKLNKALDERRDAIEGALERAEAAEAKAQASLEENAAILAEARAEAAQIREKARAEGAEILAELKAAAQEEADRVGATARAQIEAERQAAVQSLRQEVGVLALDLSEKVVGESLDEQRAAGIVDRFLADLEAEGAGRR
ncbi:F0F1 ATP synthase subunit B [Agrococcus sp. SGAir0287]|uniref:F0F1 ATP synthase subunit B n=1 Tax=Agrococcus sp. SGAir0287 TaxID=2070347 RepID=UPI001C2F9F38|nr:F0F1 ATP synthase subunit B [Agrococcus sp. SGAir0287]